MTELGPDPPTNPDLFWGGPKATSVYDSEDSIESDVREIFVYRDCKDMTESGEESNEVQETTESITEGIKRASDNVAHATETADRHRMRSGPDPDPSKSKDQSGHSSRILPTLK